MSTNIDQRVVEMRFDNKQFESNVADTMSSLGKLKDSLNLTGATKGLEEVNSAAKKVDMSGLGSAVETVQAKFSALQIMGVTALANLTNSAVNAGKRIASALTIDPVKSGFNEYETKINAIQTIMSNTASKGTTMEDVTRVIGELNTYADKTIYNFAEMTRNIGTFTAAGVGLEESASAIQGIANLAAASGSSSQQASTAMYQLSQAMASGTVKLMDWNSVVNAGMGGQKFQDALKATAKEHGIAIDGIIKKNGSFRESLQEGWLSTDILNETLQKFTVEGAKEYAKSMVDSGKYTQEQADALIKEAQAMEDAATKVKTFTQLWDTLKESAQSGWSQTWEIIVGDFEEAKETLTKFSEVIGDIINASAEARNKLLQGWKDAGGRADLVDSLFNLFEGIRSVVVPIKDAFREIFPPVTVEQLVNLTNGLKEFTSKLKLSDTASENLKRTFKGLFAVLDIVKQFFVAAWDAISPLLGGIDNLGGGILGVTAKMGDWLVNLSNTIRESKIFSEVLGGLIGVIKSIAGGMKKFFGVMKEKIVSPSLKAFRTFLDKIAKGMSVAGDIATGMKDGVVGALDAIGEALGKCSLVEMLGVVWNVIKALGSGIMKVFGGLFGGIINMASKADFSGIIDFFTSLMTGGLILSVVKLFKSFSESLNGLKEAASESIGKFGGILDSLGGTLEGFQNKLKADALKGIATAILILAAALMILALIDSDKLTQSIVAMTALFTELLYALSVVSKMDKGVGLNKTAAAIGKLASSLLVMSIALSILSTMSGEELCRGLIAVAVGLGALVGAVNLLPDKKVKSAAKAIKTMSTALLILSVALKIMGTMSWGELAVGLTAMAGSLAVLVAALHLLPKDTGLKVAGMVGLATALVILAAALKIMGTMSWGELAVGLVALAGAMTILVVALNLMTAALPGAAAMLIVAPALVILAAALKILGTMGWEDIGQAMVALGGALGILAIGLTLMIAALPGAAALVVAAGALAILTPVLLLLGAMSWESIAKGLVSIAGAFTIIGVAGLVLGPIVPTILALAGAIALIGIGTLAAGVGLTAFGAGLSALAIGFSAVAASLPVIITGLIGLVSAFVTGVIKGIGDGIVAFCNVIRDSASSICDALSTVIVALCNAITNSTPAIAECVGTVLTALLNLLVEFIPKITDAGMKIIVGFLAGIAANIGDVISTAVDVILAFLAGIAAQIPKIINAGIKLMVDFINGMADGIRTNTPKILNAVNNLMSSVFEAIGMAIGNVPKLGSQIISGLIKGIKSSAGDLLNSLLGVVKDAWGAVLDFLGIKSPSRLAAEAGRYVDEGLAGGLKSYAKMVNKEALGVGKGAMNSLNDSIGGISDVVNSDIDMQPTIRPVLDLSDVRAGAGAISGMLGTGASVGVLANVGAISSSMSKHNQNGGTEEVVSAIDKLRKDLGKVGNTTYNIDGVTYDDGSNITDAVKTIIRAARVERRTN